QKHFLARGNAKRKLQKHFLARGNAKRKLQSPHPYGHNDEQMFHHFIYTLFIYVVNDKLRLVHK
ncbi:MAG: hypothetical protein IIU52_04430, partial [Bacteroidaceae bacterium]|nr:hypothetical protein [Bacteroidaceae bacterium]